MSKKMTTEEFIAKAREVHGDKYNYSKVEYINRRTKVCIICPEHGEFWQAPNSHLNGRGCPKCGGIYKYTTEDFIAKAREVHGDKYDYSKVEYITKKTKVCIICPKHGEFWQKPANHLLGQGCPKCGGSAKLTTDDFIAKAREVHGDKYDYSKVEYVNSKTPVCIICPEHGEFWQKPNYHLSGSGCDKCGGTYKYTTEEFIAKAREVHGDKYDYSKVKYVNASTKVCIICPEHGEFWQAPNSHLNGRGCPKCGHENANMTTEEFIKKARAIHGDKYDYSKVEYANANVKVCIICPEHGEFWQLPGIHLSGHGCPKCSGRGKLATEEFIQRAKEVHGDKYDYSKVEYKGNKNKVCIICPEHGEFWQTPNSHLQGQGCPKCVGKNKTTEEFIIEAREVHGDKYDYSKVEYVNTQTPVCIICPEHGEFWQKPNIHLSGSGCPSCIKNKKLNIEDFITKAREVHGDKYDYSKVEYVNSVTKVCIICPEHGEFWQAPGKHLMGQGCPNCSGVKKEYKFNLLEEFKDEYAFRAFLETNDINILYVLLMNVVESKFGPIKKDIEKALANASEVDPIQALEDKYKSDNDEEDENEIEDTKTTIDLNDIDWDDEEAVNTAINAKITAEDKEEKQPTIEDLIRNTEQEIKVINRVEHMLTPEIREYIMKKFLNDKRRLWMAERGK